MKKKEIIAWILRLTAAIILLQTLYFKFSAHPESVALFTKLGAEPWGRIGTGIIELITGILLLITSTAFIGGFLAIGLMAGAIASHLLVIGVESKGDGGLLFTLAFIVLFCSIGVCYIYKSQGVTLLNRLRGNRIGT
jgi:putative oxidoreductase